MNFSYNTLSEALNGLFVMGYNLDFNIMDENLACHVKNTLLPPFDFEIDSFYRFEGMSNPDDQSILYAISSLKHGMKGTVINGYGISVDTDINDVMLNLPLRTTPEKS
jgi:hypothetical protein